MVKGRDTLKQILWISRHEMTPDQYADLERIMDEPIKLIPWRETVHDVAELAPWLSQVDVIAAVLPITILAQLFSLSPGIPIIQAISGRKATGQTIITPNGQQESEFIFAHLGWQQIIHLEIKTKIL